MASVLCTGVYASLRKVILEGAGHVVITAPDESTLLRACRFHKFDVAIVGHRGSPGVKKQWLAVIRKYCPRPRSWRFMLRTRRSLYQRRTIGLRHLSPTTFRTVFLSLRRENRSPQTNVISWITMTGVRAHASGIVFPCSDFQRCRPR